MLDILDTYRDQHAIVIYILQMELCSESERGWASTHSQFGLFSIFSILYSGYKPTHTL